MSSGGGGGGRQVLGWFNTKMFDETGDAVRSQGWTPFVIDTNANGKRDAYVEPDQPIDPAKDKRIQGGSYGVIPSPVDGSVWVAAPGMPGSIIRVVPGSNPTTTALAEIYEPPFNNPRSAVNAYNPRGIDIDRNGIVWTAFAGSGHLASFDRRKCKVLNGPTATGQHCPEGWTLHLTPGPRFKGVTDEANTDMLYYNWVDQFDALGMGRNVPVVTGSYSDALMAFVGGKFVVMRVPYPMGFYHRGVDGRIDDPKPAGRAEGCGPITAATTPGTTRAARATRAGPFISRSVPDPLAEMSSDRHDAWGVPATLQAVRRLTGLTGLMERRTFRSALDPPAPGGPEGPPLRIPTQADALVAEIPMKPEGMTTSKSGVRLYDDFRDNLIIDRYHPDLAAMRGSKRDRLRSEHSEDALTWNVFKSLGQIDPSFWLPLLRAKAFPADEPASEPQIVTTHLWMEVHPPPSLRLHQKDEDPVGNRHRHRDGNRRLVHRGEIQERYQQADDEQRHHQGSILRHLDVGSWYAGVRDFYFALLVMNEERSPTGVKVLKDVWPIGPAPSASTRRHDEHQGCGLLRWRDIADVLQAAADGSPRDDERVYARRAVGWMRERELY